MKHLFYVTLLLLLPGAARLRAQLYFKNYGVEQGLSSNTITAMLQDRKGFMWLGSRNGLNRFDGHAFRIFRNNFSDPGSIGSNSIFTLHEDETETLWVGTTKGVYLYDPRRESFAPFGRLPEGEVRLIKEDFQKNLWILSNSRLYRYNRVTTKLDAFTGEEFLSLCIAPSGAVWAATGRGVIKKYNDRAARFEDHVLPALAANKMGSRIQEIYPLTDSTLLVGTLNHAYLLHTGTFTLKNIFEGDPLLHNLQVHTFLRQSETDIWIGTESGLYRYNPKTGKGSRMQKEFNNPYSLTDNVIFSFCKDREGNTWIGTFFGGVNYYSQQHNNFTKYFPQAGRNSLSGNLVHEICRDDYGNLWIGTEDAGLNQLDLQTGLFTHYGPGKEQGGLSYTNIHGLLPLGRELWVGTLEHGLDVLDIPSGKVIRHYDAGEDPHSFKSNFIVTLYRNRAGDLLVGTWLGLYAYNRQADHFSPVPFFTTQVQSLYEDRQGVLWASTYGNGVYYFNPRTRRGGNLRFQAGNRNSLINNYVNHLFEDSRGTLWFCTEGGLSRYRRDGTFTQYTMESGLPDNQVFRILEDDAGLLWISTARGLVQFHPREDRMVVYTTSNGLPTGQFNYNSAYKHTDGTLFFGTVKGMVRFNPRDFLKNTFIPPVYLTGIQVNNRDLPINAASLPTSITYAQKITLPYDSSSISLDVAALSYNTPDMHAYRYKMEGIDKGWTLMKAGRSIYYRRLPPGNYTFRLKGSAGNGVWNQQETLLKIVILPPFWATAWAWLFYFLAGAAIVFTILRYYYMALNARNKRKIDLFEREKEREIYNAKIEFFTNIAHEIRTPLTLIKMPLDKLMNGPKLDAELKESLNIMKKNTNRLIDLTNQLLDFRKAEANKFSLTFTKVDINELLTDMQALFRPAAEQKGLQFRVEVPRITLHAFVDAEAVKKILVNLINNAVKYAEKTVSVRLLPFSSEDTLFHIEFKNDGFLIPADLKEKIFEPFFRIKETGKEEGTGIGLPLARALAELHQGSLELKAPTDGKNLFLLSLPIHQDTEIDLKSGGDEADAAEEATDVKETTLDASRPTILLVEDNREILHFIRRELAHGYNIRTAQNGQEALEVLERDNVQLVISDIMMPVMDGIELCRRIKTDIQYSHIPIILLTAKSSLNAKIEGLEVGADAYIEKPFAFEHLQAQITNLITNRNIVKDYFARSPLTHLKGMAHSNPDKSFLEQLNAVIGDNITDMDLDVDGLCRMMNMSRPTLYRKIKALSNLTPNELINLSRLKKAAALLAEGTYKINEVAQMVGYSIPANFTRDFSRQFGLTPSAYVQNLKGGRPA
ncbi:two-component regulator propeller domain-containing protein [Paraflavisolibacter sp. H34]|uniref:hybrid sensor histidine kinase/response regulator transcription factor n=1 Tax=Huijunlia imazamoxiresistens TaxID=3127457 RepID=UPI003015CD76